MTGTFQPCAILRSASGVAGLIHSAFWPEITAGVDTTTVFTGGRIGTTYGVCVARGAQAANIMAMRSSMESFFTGMDYSSEWMAYVQPPASAPCSRGGGTGGGMLLHG